MKWLLSKKNKETTFEGGDLRKVIVLQVETLKDHASNIFKKHTRKVKSKFHSNEAFITLSFIYMYTNKSHTVKKYLLFFGTVMHHNNTRVHHKELHKMCKSIISAKRGNEQIQ